MKTLSLNMTKLIEPKNLLSVEDASKVMSPALGSLIKSKTYINTIKKSIDSMLLSGLSKEEVIEKSSSVITAAMGTGDLSISAFKEIKLYMNEQIAKNISSESLLDEMNDNVLDNVISDILDDDVLEDDKDLNEYKTLKDQLTVVADKLVAKYTNYVKDLETSFENKYKKNLN